jgi:hypothetical protein
MAYARSKYDVLQDEHEKLEIMVSDIDIQGRHVAQEALRLHKACPTCALNTEYEYKYQAFLDLNNSFRRQVKNFELRAKVVNDLCLKIQEDLKPGHGETIQREDRLKRTLLLKIAKDQLMWLEKIKTLHTNIDAEEKLAKSKLVIPDSS